MSIKIEGLGKLVINLENRTDILLQEISFTMEQNVEKIKEKITRDAPTDRGLLKGGVGSEKLNDYKFEIFSGPATYAWIMEFGSKKKFKGNGRDGIAAEFKGKPNGGTFAQLVENMYEYIKRHGWPADVRGEKAKRSYAKFVALKIAKNGVSPANNGTGYFFKHYDRQLPIILRSLQMAIKKFSK